MIEACNYKDDIKILNYISEEEKQYLYQNAKVILFPSFYEGFGLPIIEAQKYGKPVITSSNSSMSEICNCNSILINPYNINEMKFAIINLLNDEIYEKYANLSLKNSKNFTWENCAINTLQLFNSLAI
jgi:glycosyltransferase involved in cell wall biosynthesis